MLFSFRQLSMSIEIIEAHFVVLFAKCKKKNFNANFAMEKILYKAVKLFIYYASKRTSRTYIPQYLLYGVILSCIIMPKYYFVKEKLKKQISFVCFVCLLRIPKNFLYLYIYFICFCSL